MGWFIIAHIFSTLIKLISISRKSDQEKDLEILILRHQLAILERKLDKPARPTRAEKLTLAVLFAKLKQVTNSPANQLREIIRIFQPETVLRWHRELVRRKWTYQHKRKGGRPALDLDDPLGWANGSAAGGDITGGDGRSVAGNDRGYPEGGGRVPGAGFLSRRLK
jgi:hypothetical protein